MPGEINSTPDAARKEKNLAKTPSKTAAEKMIKIKDK